MKQFPFYELSCTKRLVFRAIFTSYCIFWKGADCKEWTCVGAARGCIPTQSVRPLFLSTTFTVPDYVIIYTRYRCLVDSSLPPLYRNGREGGGTLCLTWYIVWCRWTILYKNITEMCRRGPYLHSVADLPTHLLISKIFLLTVLGSIFTVSIYTKLML